MKVKSKAQIQKNYEMAASTAGARYKDAIPNADWKDAALGGQENYVTRMSDPTVLARRSTGIEKVSDADWRKAAIDKGSGVIAGRMKAAAPKQADGFEPYRAKLERTSLTPRGPKGVGNLVRVREVVEAMIEEKEAQG